MDFLLAAFAAVCSGIVAIVVYWIKGRKPEKGSDIIADADWGDENCHKIGLKNPLSFVPLHSS